MKNFGKVFILGDSYSTFEGHIPDGYEPYYKKENTPYSSLNDVTLTWWHRLMKNTGSKLLMNCSWSGTTICHTGYNGADCSDKSFAARMDNLIETGFFKDNVPDTLFVFGGTNDSWADSPIGKIMYSAWKKEDLYSTLPAFCYLLSRIKEHLPSTRLICIINCDLKDEITTGFKTACEKYGVQYLTLKCIDKENGHPTALGMEQIESQIAAIL